MLETAALVAKYRGLPGFAVFCESFLKTVRQSFCVGQMAANKIKIGKGATRAAARTAAERLTGSGQGTAGAEEPHDLVSGTRLLQSL